MPAAAPHAVRSFYAQAPGFADNANQRRFSHDGGPCAAGGGNWASDAPDAGNALGGMAHTLHLLNR